MIYSHIKSGAIGNPLRDSELYDSVDIPGRFPTKLIPWKEKQKHETSREKPGTRRHPRLERESLAMLFGHRALRYYLCAWYAH